VEELRGRLLRKGFEGREVAGCIRWLEELDILDDERFAKAYLRGRLRFSPRSPALLRTELRKRGIAVELAGEAVEAVLQEEEVDKAHLSRKAARRWVRKQSSGAQDHLLGTRFSPEREKARRRLYGYLARRGFRGDASRAGMEAGEEEALRLRG
jgi:regulatory protein